MASVYSVRHLVAIAEDAGAGAMECSAGAVQRVVSLVRAQPARYSAGAASRLHVRPEEPAPAAAEYSEEVVFPRHRAVPAEKAKTKWQVFAEQKGIAKKKGGRRVFDEDEQRLVPKYGRGSKRDLDQQWVIELKDGEDAGVDRHRELRREKRERVQKNRRSQEQNRKRARSGEGLLGGATPRP